MRFKINAIFLKRPVLSTWYYIYLSFLRIQFNKNTFLVVYVGRKVASIVEKFHSLYSPYERLTNPIISYIYLYISLRMPKCFSWKYFSRNPWSISLEDKCNPVWVSNNADHLIVKLYLLQLIWAPLCRQPTHSDQICVSHIKNDLFCHKLNWIKHIMWLLSTFV